MSTSSQEARTWQISVQERLEASIRTIPNVGHLHQQCGVLIVAHHDHVAVDLIIRYAVVLEVGHDLADFRRRQALIQLRVRLLAHGHRQRDHSDQDHSQGSGQYDASPGQQRTYVLEDVSTETTASVRLQMRSGTMLTDNEANSVSHGFL